MEKSYRIFLKVSVKRDCLGDFDCQISSYVCFHILLLETLSTKCMERVDSHTAFFPPPPFPQHRLRDGSLVTSLIALFYWAWWSTEVTNVDPTLLLMFFILSNNLFSCLIHLCLLPAVACQDYFGYSRYIQYSNFEASIGLWNFMYFHVLFTNRVFSSHFRQEKATLLGYENYAALSLSTKMAAKSKHVWQLIHGLKDKSKQAAQR